METTAGTLEIELKPNVAPKAVENFMKLAEKGFYNGIIFHRVIKGFMIQGGDPTGTGRGGESVWGAPFEDECSPSLAFDKAGLLAMANRGPKTNGSQFFITCAETPWLQGKHTIFGEITAGMEIVRKIEACPTDVNDKPRDDQKILKITLKTT